MEQSFSLSFDLALEKIRQDDQKRKRPTKTPEQRYKTLAKK
jgi:hypothetical protein